MRALALLFLALALAPEAAAQARHVEAGARFDALSGAYADGRSAYVGVHLPRTGGWTRLDVSSEDRFGEQAVVYGGAVGQDFGPRWVVVGSAGSSTSGIVYPRLSAGLGVGRKWGADKRVLTTLSAAVTDARDVHRDVTVAGEVAVYARRAIVQVGGRVAQSQPGDALGYGTHLIVTLGDPTGRRFTGRLGGGREAYLLVEPAPLDVSFRSIEAQAGWHEPIGGPWVASVRAGLYANPYYTRLGVQTGLARRF